MCEIGDLIIYTLWIVQEPTNVDADWIVIQTNLDGTVNRTASAMMELLHLCLGTSR